MHPFDQLRQRTASVLSQYVIVSASGLDTVATEMYLFQFVGPRSRQKGMPREDVVVFVDPITSTLHSHS